MKSQNTKSSDQLKREVDQQIYKVRNDLDALQGRLTPGQFIDDAIFHKQGRNLGSTIEFLKQNPVGTTFLSLGTILLMEDENHLTMERNARLKATTVKDSVKSVSATIRDQLPHKDLNAGTAPSMGDIAKDKIGNMKETVQSKVTDIKDKLPTSEEIKAKVSDVKQSVSTKIDEVKTDASAKVDEVKDKFVSDSDFGTQESNFSFTNETSPGIRDKASDIYSSGKERVTDIYSKSRDQFKAMDPMTYMALGAGLGALTGAALPVSEAEKNLVSEKFDERISGLGTDLQDAINEVSNILKDLVVQDVKDYSFRPFK